MMLYFSIGFALGSFIASVVFAVAIAGVGHELINAIKALTKAVTGRMSPDDDVTDLSFLKLEFDKTLRKECANGQS